MRVFGLWHGGSDYGYPSVDTSAETFPSIEAARAAHQSRYWHGGREPQLFTYVDGRAEYVYCPGVGVDAEMTLFMYDPRQVSDPYPDRRVVIGRQGAAHVVHC